MLVTLLFSKFGLFTRLRKLKPQLDRAVNWTIIGLVVVYVGQLIWWISQGAPH